MKSDPIVIQKLCLDVFTEEVKAPEALLQEAMDWLKAEALPMLEARTAGMRSQASHLLLEKLEVDLTVEQGTDWKASMVNSLVEALQEATRNDVSEPEVSLRDLETSAEKISETDHQGREERILVAWVHHLDYGWLPWWISALGTTGLQNLLTELEVEKLLLSAPVVKVLQTRPSAATRMASQFTFSELEAMLTAVYQKGPEILKVLSLIPNDILTRTAKWANVLRALPELVSPSHGEKVARDMPTPAFWLPTVLQHIQKKEELKAWESILVQLPPEMLSEVPLNITKKDSQTVNFHPLIDSILEEKRSQFTPSEESSQDIAAPTKQGILGNPDDVIYTEHVGIVLLHPFLPSLFRNLGLCDEADEWKDQSSQELAAHLLSRLARGDWEAMEDELVLPRVLAGFPAEEVLLPLESDPELELLLETELEEILGIVQANWTPMRSCTWESLAVDFLQRPGKLSRSAAGHWKLQVESRITDVLLRRLGWGLSPVKLPWMDELLMVEWTQ